MKKFLFYFGAAIYLSSCAPSLNMTLNRRLPPQQENVQVIVYNLDDKIPENSFVIGNARIYDGGFAVKCGYESVIDQAKHVTRRMGGNAIKITEHKKPGVVSSCHQIRFDILSIGSEGIKIIKDTTIKDNKPVQGTETRGDGSNVWNKRDIFAVGYQIGGFSLVGFEYEIRAGDYVGINLGAGFKGFTVGFKIHTNERKNSGSFLFSYKDGGFGLISTTGVEYCGRLVFMKENDFGLHYQIGLARMLSINRDFEKYLYKNQKAPSVTMTMGIGFSW